MSGPLEIVGGDAPVCADGVCVVGTVTVAWRTDDVPADELLTELVTQHLGHDSFTMTRACGSCGSSTHGRPVVAADRPVEVSLARTRGLVVVAVGTCGALGVDVEREGAASFDSFARVARHPDEPADDDPTRVWVRKEAVLKATGHGLAVDPRDLLVAGSGADAVSWPTAVADPGPVWVGDLGVPVGFVAAIAVVGPGVPTVVTPPRPPGAPGD